MENRTAIKDLYQKVAADSTLLEKFQAIQKDAEAVGREATEAKLIAFAKEAGYDVTMKDAAEYFRELAEKGQSGELSETELDLVAGGKSGWGIAAIVTTAATLGAGCFMVSLTFGMLLIKDNPYKCENMFN